MLAVPSCCECLHLSQFTVAIGLSYMAHPNGCRHELTLMPRLRPYPMGAIGSCNSHKGVREVWTCAWLMYMTDVQGSVYHWTISTGFSLAEATNLYVGQPGQLLSHLQDWYTLLCSACTQVSTLSCSPRPIPFCMLFRVLVFEHMWGLCTLLKRSDVMLLRGAL